MIEPRPLSFDLAKSTGWATSYPSDPSRPLYGTILIDPEGGREQGRAYHTLRRRAAELIALNKPTVLTYEAPLPERDNEGNVIHGFSTAVFLLGLCAIIEELGFACGLKVWACDVQTARLHFVGRGRSKKPDVMHKCRVFGWRPANFDEGDALCLWDYSRSALKAGAALAAQQKTAEQQWGER